MNKLEDFTEGSDWLTAIGTKLRFESIDDEHGAVLFTTNEPHDYEVDDSGFIGFGCAWKFFTKIESK